MHQSAAPRMTMPTPFSTPSSATRISSQPIMLTAKCRFLPPYSVPPGRLLEFKTSVSFLFVFLAIFLLALPFAFKPAQGEDVVLRIALPDWPLDRKMKEFADTHYSAPSGRMVTIESDFIPLPEYYTKIANSLSSGSGKYNMTVVNSHSLPAFIESGYYVNLKDFVGPDSPLQSSPRKSSPATCIRVLRWYPQCPRGSATRHRVHILE